MMLTRDPRWGYGLCGEVYKRQEYGCLLFFTTGRLVSATYYDTRSQGVSVRCVKE